jgi:hypothetical protein
MKCIMRIAACIVAVQVLSVLATRDAVAVSITLNLVQAESYVLQTGDFSTLPMLPQDGIAGTTDLNPARPSNETTFQGTITVDVDNVMVPTSIKILSSAADADVSGAWLPEVEPYLDVDGDLNFGEFGDDSVTTVGDNPAPATDADWGIRIFHPAFGANIAWGAARDIVYNVRTLDSTNNLVFVPVDGAGNFSPMDADPNNNVNFEFATGWFDYWVAPGAGTIRGRSELAGGDDDTLGGPSKYTVTPLGGGLTELKLFIPINIDSLGSDANFFYDGQFVATLIIPEPSSFVLLGLAGALAALVGVRRRK